MGEPHVGCPGPGEQAAAAVGALPSRRGTARVFCRRGRGRARARNPSGGLGEAPLGASLGGETPLRRFGRFLRASRCCWTPGVLFACC